MSTAALLAYNARSRTRTKILPPTSPKGRLWHGTTSGYAYGCSCERCRRANRIAQRMWRQRERYEGV